MKYIKKATKFTILIVLLFIIFNIAAYSYAYLSPKLQIKSANKFMLFDQDNELFFQGSGDSKWVSLDNISDNVVKTTIETEDKNFYKHKGFDYLRIMKAMYINVVSRNKNQGASTITQQYAKNLFLDFSKTWKRKWDEMWYTIEIETHYKKKDILEGYLNTINYGHGMYGIENASQFYFGKKAKDLDLAEAAILTGIPKSPSNYSPLINYDKAKERQILILKNLLKEKKISNEEYNQASNEKLTFVGEKEKEELSTVMYYQDAVMKELNSLKEIPSTFLETGGLKIYTSLNLKSQKELEANVKETLGDRIRNSCCFVRPSNWWSQGISWWKRLH